MNKFKELVFDLQDNLCIIRILTTAGFMLVFTVWCVMCVKSGKISDIPTGVVTILLGLLGAMLGKQFVEKKDKGESGG